VKSYPGKISITIADKGRTDSVAAEAIDGQVALISRTIYLSPDQGGAFKTYESELERKFGGHQSSMSRQYVSEEAARAERPELVIWQYDKNGSIIHAMPYTASRDFATNPGCAVLITGKLGRSPSATPYGAIDTDLPPNHRPATMGAIS
jgi:hypothetical protein